MQLTTLSTWRTCRLLNWLIRQCSRSWLKFRLQACHSLQRLVCCPWDLGTSNYRKQSVGHTAQVSLIWQKAGGTAVRAQVLQPPCLPCETGRDPGKSPQPQ